MAIVDRSLDLDGEPLGPCGDGDAIGRSKRPLLLGSTDRVRQRFEEQFGGALARPRKLCELGGKIGRGVVSRDGNGMGLGNLAQFLGWLGG